MRIISNDGKKYVDVGNSDIWYALYSTACISFGLKKKKIKNAISFMESGKCKANTGYETARQFNLIRDELSRIPPEKLIYDMRDRKKSAPWINKISPAITSCGNLFTTADGKDLIAEVVGILCYGEIAGTDIETE